MLLQYPHMYLAILGSHPRLSLAELKRTSADVILHTNTTATFTGAHYSQFGGSSKIARVVDEIPTTRIDEIESHLLENIASYLADQSEAKLSFGISVYGAKWTRYKDLCFNMKKQLKHHGFRPRVVFGRSQALNSAHVLHNQLHRSQSELVISIGKHSTLIGRSVWVQDIDAFTKRDMERPCRDMNVGMLPPKLARIMVNMAGGAHIFDPFCGSGVILQEALLMEKDASGSDIDPRMVDCSRNNLQWLKQEFNVKSPEAVFTADARHVTAPETADAVASEGYLGPLMTGPSSREYLEKIAEESDTLLRETLQNLHPQLTAGTPLCIAAPAWRHEKQTITPHLVSRAYAQSHSAQNRTEEIDDLTSLGYNLIDLDGIIASDLLYMRHDQYVGRQLMILERV